MKRLILTWYFNPTPHLIFHSLAVARIKSSLVRNRDGIATIDLCWKYTNFVNLHIIYGKKLSVIL